MGSMYIPTEMSPFFFQNPEPIIPRPLTGLARDQAAREWRLVSDIMSVISRSGLRPAELTGIPRPSYVDVHSILCHTSFVENMCVSG